MNAGNAKYITIYEWMNELDLSPVEKIAYALVYSFCKKGECFNGKNSYLQEWLGCTKKTAINTMAALEEKGYISKEQQMVNGKVSNIYTLGVQNLHPRGVKITPEGCKNYTDGVQNLHPYNNKDNNKDNILTLPAHVREKIEVIKKWLTENALGTESLAIRNQLIQGQTAIEDIVKILEPYVEIYYTEQLEQGKGDIKMRGRTDILSHFAKLLPTYIRKGKEQEQQKLKDNETSTDPITRAMQDFAAGWDNATGGM